MSDLSEKIKQAGQARPAEPPAEGSIVNRVAESDILTFNLEELWDGRETAELDIEPFLYEGLVVREKLFREHVKATDWSRFADRHVAVFCSTDAIVPTWAFMLVASRLEPVAASVHVGSIPDLFRAYYASALERYDFSPYRNRIVVVKGCSSDVVPAAAYADVTVRLQKVARKLMFGEACSSVPLWRKK